MADHFSICARQINDNCEIFFDLKSRGWPRNRFRCVAGGRLCRQSEKPSRSAATRLSIDRSHHSAGSRRGGFEIGGGGISQRFPIINTNQLQFVVAIRKIQRPNTIQSNLATSPTEFEKTIRSAGLSLTVGVNPCRFDFYVGLISTRAYWILQTNKTRLYFGANLQPFKGATVSGNFSHFSGRRTEYCINKNANFDVQLPIIQHRKGNSQNSEACICPFGRPYARPRYRSMSNRTRTRRQRGLRLFL